ncbi:hypothetical protein CJ030_MR2G016667 [Morella rubra]|uniref:Uncharacterized protein n=1 Tax=Morella rubra TaxID=262757 RepID=A0A6A1WJ95_9ROSI|nr:hypothetical protein CJ030_MR2G016667 [Morella rubra]
MGSVSGVTVNLLIMLTLGTTDLLVSLPCTFPKVPRLIELTLSALALDYVSLRKESPAAPVFPLTSKTTKENAAIIGEKGVRG